MSLDTVLGLPVHVLVVHLVVVGVPVMCVLTVIAAARRRWRLRTAWVVVALNAGLLAVTLVAKRAGQVLEQRVGPAAVAEHAALGTLMPWFVLGLLVVSVLIPVVRHRRSMATPVLVLVVLVAAANLVWVHRVGLSGADAVWGQVVESTNA